MEKRYKHILLLLMVSGCGTIGVQTPLHTNREDGAVITAKLPAFGDEESAGARSARSIESAASQFSKESLPHNVWFIQIGVFTEKKNAMESIRSIESRRLKTAVQEGRQGNRSIYRVLVGPYTSQSDGMHHLHIIRKQTSWNDAFLVAP